MNRRSLLRGAGGVLAGLLGIRAVCGGKASASILGHPRKPDGPCGVLVAPMPTKGGEYWVNMASVPKPEPVLFVGGPLHGTIRPWERQWRDIYKVSNRASGDPWGVIEYTRHGPYARADHGRDVLDRGKAMLIACSRGDEAWSRWSKSFLRPVQA